MQISFLLAENSYCTPSPKNPMWSGGKETGENGEAVLLLAPAKADTFRAAAATSSVSASSSSIGGHPTYFSNDDIVQKRLKEINGTCAIDSVTMTNPNCELCQQPMHLISQINAPVDSLDRTMYIFGCNRAKCWRDASDKTKTNSKDDGIAREGRFVIGGGGVVRCLRSQQQASITSPSTTASGQQTTDQSAKKSNSNTMSGGWGDDDMQADSEWGGAAADDDDWDDTTLDDGGGIDDLEAMLTACEMKEKDKTSSTQKGKKNKKQAKDASKTGQKNDAQSDDMAFTRFDLEMYEEPYGISRGIIKGPQVDDKVDDDDDDDTIGATGASDDKIQKLLSKYLEEEEDQDIISVLGGSAKDNTIAPSSGSGGREKYERLPPDERAFLAFSDRIKRSPEQVARYAYGGEPLWSVPTLMQKQQKSKKGKGMHQKLNEASSGNQFPPVPPCACGKKRVFELELVPSILFALDVDVHAQAATQDIATDDSAEMAKSSKSDVERRMNNEFGNGGMDWGALAIYSCPASCDHSREEFVVAQESVDGKPVKREFNIVSSQDGDKVEQAGSDGDE